MSRIKMLQFNKYIVEIQGKFYNTITKTLHRKDQSEEYYKSRFFFVGQEHELITNYLVAQPTQLSLSLATTWECSLRCSHCSVLHKLKKTDLGSIDASALKAFLENYYDYFKPNEKFLGYVSFVGGEVGLKIKQTQQLMDVIEKSWLNNLHRKVYSCTTNLFYNLTSEHLHFFKQLHNLEVSVDGNEKDHNKQRRTYNESSLLNNPFQTTIKNIEFLCEHGMSDKICIKASLDDEVFCNLDEKLKFYEMFLRMGLKYENILWKCIHPTKLRQSQTEAFKEFCKKGGRPQTIPCCKYRFMNKFCVTSDNKIYSNYFQNEDTSESYLGYLTDQISDIKEKYKNLILETMPILKDENCMKCPVIGFCWGQCLNSNEIINKKPSEMCNQKALINQIEKKLNITYESN